MPLWRRRSKRASLSENDGPPVLPDTQSISTKGGRRRISLSLPHLRALYAPRRAVSQPPGDEEVGESYGQATQIWSNYTGNGWAQRASSTVDLKTAAVSPVVGVSRDEVVPTDGGFPPLAVQSETWNKRSHRSVFRKAVGLHRSGFLKPGTPPVGEGAPMSSQQKHYSANVPHSHGVGPTQDTGHPGIVLSNLIAPSIKSADTQSLQPPVPVSGPPLSPRKRERGPPPSAFPGIPGYNLASDFRVSPAVHTAAQQRPDPQSIRGVIESARVISLRKSRAPTRLNVMVIGEGATGKTLYLRALLQTLLSHNDDPYNSEEEEEVCLASVSDPKLLQKANEFGLDGHGRHLRTKDVQIVSGLELVPSNELLLNGLTADRGEGKTATESPDNCHGVKISEHLSEFRGNRPAGRRKGSMSSRHSATVSLLGGAAPPNRLRLSLIDTPSLPAVLPASLAALPTGGASSIERAPYFLKPILDEIVTRYSRTLKEEAKLRRVPNKSASIEGEHVHTVIWFVDPREILQGDRSWWKEQRDRMQWDSRTEGKSSAPKAKRRKENRSKAPGTVPVAENTERASPGGETAIRHRALSNPGRGLVSPARGFTLRRSASAAYLKGSQTGAGEPRPRSWQENADIRALSSQVVQPETMQKELRKDGDPTTSAREHVRGEASFAPSTKPVNKADAEGDDEAMLVKTLTVDVEVKELKGEEDDVSSEDDEDEYLPNLSPSQKLALYHILPLVPVVPVIAKAEMLTVVQLTTVRQAIHRGWSEVTEQLKAEGSKDETMCPTLDWGWIGLSTEQLTEDKEEVHKRHGGEDENKLSPDEQAVKVIQIRSSRSYSACGEQTSSAHIKGDSSISDVDVRSDSPEAELRSSSEPRIFEQTRPLFDKRKVGMQRRTQSQSTNTTIATSEDASREREGQEIAESDPRALLGVEDIVPANERLHQCWPLAIWTPDVSLARHQGLHECDQSARTGVGTAGPSGETAASCAGQQSFKSPYRDVIVGGYGGGKGQTFSHSLSLTRTYPWGSTLHLLNPQHSDFLALKCMLLGTHVSAILETSKEAFEFWRGVTLERKLMEQQRERQLTQQAIARVPAPESANGKEKDWVVV